MKIIASILFAISLGTSASAYAGGLPSTLEATQSVLLDKTGQVLPSATTSLLIALDARLDGLGSSTPTTIDPELLPALQNEIQATGRKFSAIRGAALLMDVHTGSILAAVSETMNGEPSAFLAEPVELGATLMTITVAAALDAEAIQVTDTFDVSKPIRVGERVINDYVRREGRLGPMQILQESTNIGAAQVGLRLGYDRYRSFLDKLGLLALPRTGAEVGANAVAQMSYGDMVSVYPTRLTAAYATLTNGGQKVKPTPLPDEAPEKVSVISEELSSTIRGYLGNAVQNGTGFKAKHSAIKIGGKTGTADHLNGDVLSSFIAVFPIYEPKYALYVAFDEPKGIDQTYGFNTGGWVAAPAACKIISESAAHLGFTQTGACPNL